MMSLIRRSLFLLGCALAAACTSSTPSYSLEFTAPDAITLAPGDSAPLEMTVTRRSQESGEVTISLSNAPEGITLEPSEFVLPEGEESVTVSPTLTVSPTVPELGLNRILLAAEDAANDLISAFSIYVVVLQPPAPQPDFSIAVEPRQLSLFAGQGDQVRVTLTRSQGFTGPVTLTLESPTSRIFAETTTITAEQTFQELPIQTERSTTRIPVPTTIIATSEDGRQATTGLTVNVR